MSDRFERCETAVKKIYDELLKLDDNEGADTFDLINYICNGFRDEVEDMIRKDGPLKDHSLERK